MIGSLNNKARVSAAPTNCQGHAPALGQDLNNKARASAAPTNRQGYAPALGQGYSSKHHWDLEQINSKLNIWAYVVGTT